MAEDLYRRHPSHGLFPFMLREKWVYIGAFFLIFMCFFSQYGFCWDCFFFVGIDLKFVLHQPLGNSLWSVLRKVKINLIKAFHTALNFQQDCFLFSPAFAGSHTLFISSKNLLVFSLSGPALDSLFFFSGLTTWNMLSLLFFKFANVFLDFETFRCVVFVSKPMKYLVDILRSRVGGMFKSK